MMAITHCAIALSGTSLILGTANPLALGLAIIGSQLPDLDTTTSTIGKIFFPISSWIEDRFPHRSVTHCLLATAAIAVVSISIGYFSGDIKAAIASLEELQQTYPGTDIFLNGELTVDFPEDVKIPVEPNQMVTAELVKSSLKFSYCELGRAISLLKEQYAVGTVEVKILRS